MSEFKVEIGVVLGMVATMLMFAFAGGADILVAPSLDDPTFIATTNMMEATCREQVDAVCAGMRQAHAQSFVAYAVLRLSWVAALLGTALVSVGMANAWVRRDG